MSVVGGCLSDVRPTENFGSTCNHFRQNSFHATKGTTKSREGAEHAFCSLFIIFMKLEKSIHRMMNEDESSSSENRESLERKEENWKN